LGSSCTDALAETVDTYTYENAIQDCLAKLKFSQASPILEEISNMEFMNTDPLARKLVERVINIKNQISDKINEGKLLESIGVVDAWHNLTYYKSLVYSDYEATRRKALEGVIEELENSDSEQLKEIADDIKENIEEYATKQKNDTKRRLDYQVMGLPDHPVFTEPEKIAIKLIELEPLYANFASYSSDMVEYIESAHSIEVDFPTTNPEKEGE
jgi:vacuolar-type H+-ATPase subunit I/STV1